MVQRTNLVGDNKCKIIGPLILFMVQLFEKNSKYTYTIVVGENIYTCTKEENGTTESKK